MTGQLVGRGCGTGRRVPPCRQLLAGASWACVACPWGSHTLKLTTHANSSEPPWSPHLDSRLFMAGMATPSPMPMAARASSSTGSETRAAMGVSTVARLHHT